MQLRSKHVCRICNKPFQPTTLLLVLRDDPLVFHQLTSFCCSIRVFECVQDQIFRFRILLQKDPSSIQDDSAQVAALTSNHFCLIVSTKPLVDINLFHITNHACELMVRTHNILNTQFIYLTYLLIRSDIFLSKLDRTFSQRQVLYMLPF